MARLPNGCGRMLCALLQFGSLVSAVNRPSPPTARTRRSEPRTALSKRFSSESSSMRSWPETMTSGAPIMSGQKIGPSSLVSRTMCWIGALESSDSMLPTTGLVGGRGIGLNLLGDAIAKLSPAVTYLSAVIASEATLLRLLRKLRRVQVRRSASARRRKQSSSCACGRGLLRRFAPRNDDPLAKPLSTPLDQLGADLFRLFLLRPMA